MTEREIGLLVLHDLGSSVAGDAWGEAFSSWPGDVLAPDLPGHGDAPMPAGGHHELGDSVFAVAPLLAGRSGPPPVVVGVGRNGHAARILALAGRASALVLVDGLGGPWLDTAGWNEALRSLRHEILATPRALEAHEGPEPDVRAGLVQRSTNRDHVVAACERIAVPAMVVETPGSPTPDAGELTAVFPDATLVEVDESTPATVAAAVSAWWADR